MAYTIIDHGPPPIARATHKGWGVEVIAAKDAAGAYTPEVMLLPPLATGWLRFDMEGAACESAHKAFELGVRRASDHIDGRDVVGP